jgi:hypothetical protein
MGDWEISDILIFQHSGKEIQYRCLWPVIKIACKPIICWDRALVL